MRARGAARAGQRAAARAPAGQRAAARAPARAPRACALRARAHAAPAGRRRILHTHHIPREFTEFRKSFMAVLYSYLSLHAMVTVLSSAKRDIGYLIAFDKTFKYK